MLLFEAVCVAFSRVCAVASKKRLYCIYPARWRAGSRRTNCCRGGWAVRNSERESAAVTQERKQCPNSRMCTSFVDYCRCPSKLADVGTVSFFFFMLPASTLPPFASQSACPRKDTAVARYLLVAWRSVLCGRNSLAKAECLCNFCKLTRKEGHATKEITQKRENHVADKRRHSTLPNIGAPRHEAGVARVVTGGPGRSYQAC